MERKFTITGLDKIKAIVVDEKEDSFKGFGPNVYIIPEELDNEYDFGDYTYDVDDNKNIIVIHAYYFDSLYRDPVSIMSVLNDLLRKICNNKDIDLNKETTTFVDFCKSKMTIYNNE